MCVCLDGTGTGTGTGSSPARWHALLAPRLSAHGTRSSRTVGRQFGNFHCCARAAAGPRCNNNKSETCNTSAAIPSRAVCELLLQPSLEEHQSVCGRPVPLPDFLPTVTPVARSFHRRRWRLACTRLGLHHSPRNERLDSASLLLLHRGRDTIRGVSGQLTRPLGLLLRLLELTNGLQAAAQHRCVHGMPEVEGLWTRSTSIQSGQ